MNKEDLVEYFKRNPRNNDFPEIINALRVICANEKSTDVLEILDIALKRSKTSSNSKQQVDLFELKIKQIYHQKENRQEVEEILEEMIQTAKIANYIEGLALSFQIKGFIEFLKGNREMSSTHINSAIGLLNNLESVNPYVLTICNYSFAIDRWISYRDINTANILEECVEYFYSNGFYHGLAMTLGVLSVIYQQIQDEKKSMKLIKRIVRDISSVEKMPREIQSVVQFFIGFSHALSFNLQTAKNHLIEAQSFLKYIYRKSIYSGYYLLTLTQLTMIYALQGKLEQSAKYMKMVNTLIEEGIVTKNFDSFNVKQITHSFNLVTFYIKSRQHSFQTEDLQELVQIIVEGIDKYYSNAMFFSEFLLNSNLSKEQLIEIKNSKNQSTKRVEHVINFLIEKTAKTDEQQTIKSILILKERPGKEKMTTVEKAFADLLAAQEYYKIKRFAEIYPLLKQYKNRLYSIEVLELRVFMEAFIQVGAFKNGDPLGPALQYMAIKKCRDHGFSRLENTLLDYLQLQRMEIARTV